MNNSTENIQGQIEDNSDEPEEICNSSSVVSEVEKKIDELLTQMNSLNLKITGLEEKIKENNDVIREITENLEDEKQTQLRMAQVYMNPMMGGMPKSPFSSPNGTFFHSSADEREGNGIY